MTLEEISSRVLCIKMKVRFIIMKITAQEAADYLDGCEYRNEVDEEFLKLLEDNNLIVVFGRQPKFTVAIGGALEANLPFNTDKQSKKTFWFVRYPNEHKLFDSNYPPLSDYKRKKSDVIGEEWIPYLESSHVTEYYIKALSDLTLTIEGKNEYLTWFFETNMPNFSQFFVCDGDEYYCSGLVIDISELTLNKEDKKE